MCWKASAEPTVAAMATARKKAVRVRWRPVSAFMVAVDGGQSLSLIRRHASSSDSAARSVMSVSDDDIEQNQGGGGGAGDQSQPLLDEIADRLAIAAQQPGEEQEARAARDDRRAR